jgi:hypothetical protein
MDTIYKSVMYIILIISYAINLYLLRLTIHNKLFLFSEISCVTLFSILFGLCLVYKLDYLTFWLILCYFVFVALFMY